MRISAMFTAVRAVLGFSLESSSRIDREAAARLLARWGFPALRDGELNPQMFRPGTPADRARWNAIARREELAFTDALTALQDGSVRVAVRDVVIPRGGVGLYIVLVPEDICLFFEDPNDYGQTTYLFEVPQFTSRQLYGAALTEEHPVWVIH